MGETNSLNTDENKMSLEKKRPPEEKEPTEDFEIIDSAGERVMIETGIIKLCEKINKENYDKLFFLDKSARPLAWVLYEVIKAGKVDLELSDIKFINPPEDTYSSSSFKQEQKFFKTWSDYIKNGDRICLVDEMRATGSSYKFIKDLIYSTLDKAEIEIDIDDFDVMSTWPSWHSNTEDIGVKEEGGYDIVTTRSENRDDTLRKECTYIGKRVVKHFDSVKTGLDTINEKNVRDILNKIGIKPEKKLDSSNSIEVKREDILHKIRQDQFSKKESFIFVNLLLERLVHFDETALSEEGNYKAKTKIFVEDYDEAIQYLSQQAEKWIMNSC